MATKKRKTRKEKIRASYRLENFKLKAEEQAKRKDQREFGYLDKQYIGKDLLKTVVYSGVIIGWLLLAKRWLG